MNLGTAKGVATADLARAAALAARPFLDGSPHRHRSRTPAGAPDKLGLKAAAVRYLAVSQVCHELPGPFGAVLLSGDAVHIEERETENAMNAKQAREE
jgi:hypothetical protein